MPDPDGKNAKRVPDIVPGTRFRWEPILPLGSEIDDVDARNDEARVCVVAPQPQMLLVGLQQDDIVQRHGDQPDILRQRGGYAFLAVGVPARVSSAKRVPASVWMR